MAQGIANVVAPFFGGIPATGAIARTATNIRSGGRTPVAGIVHALTLLVIVLVGGAARALRSARPRSPPCSSSSRSTWATGARSASCAAIRSPIARCCSRPSSITVVFDLTLAVQIGLVLASLFFIYRVSELTRVERITLDDVPRGDRRVQGVRLAVLRLGRRSSSRCSIPRHTPERIVILELHQVISLDNTALETLDALRASLRRRGGQLLLCGLNRHPAEQVARSAFGAELGDENILPHLAAALIRAQQIAAATSGTRRGRTAAAAARRFRHR